MSQNKQVDSETNTTPVLELRSVSYGASTEGSLRLDHFTARILPGEWIKATLESHHDPRELASLLVGLRKPEFGCVYFQGTDWTTDDYLHHSQMRSQVGRVFSGPAWIQNLSVNENIRLSQLQQGIELLRIQEQIESSLRRLAGTKTHVVKRALGRRPTFVEPSTLKVCQLIRATYFQPRLLLLERPLRMVPDSVRREFLSVVAELRVSGTAILWFADDNDELASLSEEAINTWTISEGTMSNS